MSTINPIGLDRVLSYYRYSIDQIGGLLNCLGYTKTLKSPSDACGVRASITEWKHHVGLV